MREFLLVVQIMAIGLLVLESGYIFMKWRTKLQGYLLAICVSTLLNSLGYFFSIQASSLSEYLMGIRMSYAGRIWVPFSLLLFVNALCKKRNNKPFMVGLAFLHLAVYGVVITCTHHSLYYQNMSLDTSGLFPCLSMTNGIVHEIYNYVIIIYMVYGLFLLIRTLIREKNPIQRRSLMLVLAAILSDSIFYLIEIYGATTGFDDTVLGYAISSVFMFIAIFKYSILDTLKIVGDYVIDEVSEGIIVINKNNEIEYYNQPAKKIYPVLEHYSPQILEGIRNSILKQEPLTVDGRFYRATERDLVKDGSVIGTIYVIADVTELNRYMEQLKEQKEIAEAANASKSAFLSVVSHEIRTPMNAVVGMTDLLLKDSDELSDKQEKYLKNIKNSGSSLVMIVNDILDQSKIEAGKMEIVEDLYELRPMTEDVRMIIENRIGNKPVELVIDIDDTIPQFLVGDSLRIRQILINLMNNAVKFTEEGFIKLSISRKELAEEKMLLRFAVEDSGQGIKAEDLSKLGKAFSQVDTKKNHSKEGTGLGLSISRDFISLMGGRLEVTSEYEKGSEFFFSIYQGICEEKDIQEDGGIINQPWQEDVSFTAPNVHILVVDDNEVNVMIMEELLAMLQIATDHAESGEEAIELVKKNRYDLIFMDYMMPYMDGVEATEQIRKLSMQAMTDEDTELQTYYESVPIIALSGDTSEDTRKKFMSAGINDFTDKPVDLPKIKGKLVKWLPADSIVY